MGELQYCFNIVKYCKDIVAIYRAACLLREGPQYPAFGQRSQIGADSARKTEIESLKIDFQLDAGRHLM